MRIVHGLEGLRSLAPGSVLSIGNFDGVHRGHHRILEIAAGLKAGSAAGEIVLATFEPHPLTVIRPAIAPPRLTPVAVKERLLAGQGVDTLVVLAPTPDVLDLTAEAFWAILRDEVRPRCLIEGETFSFGKGRGGTTGKLREWSRGTAISLHVVEPVEIALLNLQVVPVSSSLIRWLIGYGRMRDAGICLGRAYALFGEVVKGFQRGRTIGFPTVNLRCDGQLVPADGVYAGACPIDGRIYPAAISIGTLPTFEENTRQIEAHLIGFEGDLYGKSIELQVHDWLREQRKFLSVDELKRQLGQDVAEAQARGEAAGRAGARPIAFASPEAAAAS